MVKPVIKATNTAKQRKSPQNSTTARVAYNLESQHRS